MQEGDKYYYPVFTNRKKSSSVAGVCLLGTRVLFLASPGTEFAVKGSVLHAKVCPQSCGFLPSAEA